jgi:response regulator RpfG family c-di-GMP phosphodiesterase
MIELQQPKSESDDQVNILYIDDEENNLISFKASFRKRFNIYLASDTQKARDILKENDIHIIISDQRMPTETGIQFFEQIKDLYPLVIRVLLTGYADIEAVIDGINRAQLYRYHSKPWDETELELTIRTGYKMQYLEKENIKLTIELKKVNEQLEFMLRQNLIS